MRRAVHRAVLTLKYSKYVPVRRFLICIGCALAVPVNAGDLLEAYCLAEQNDAKYRAAVANYQATRTRLPQARAGSCRR